jgi:hypothetical protein
MKTLKVFLLSLILLLLLSTGVRAEFFTDVIVTSANGIWTDSRAYATLNAAVTAVGANQRTIKIVSPQVVTSLTIPSNVTLEFDRDGSITNSGQLTINTKNIIAPNRQIFTGAGNIDFANGSVIKTGWFNSIESAFALTVNDTVTLIVSKAQTITASYSPGNNVSLQWNAPGNILTVNAGVTVSNIGQVVAGNYQLFAGAGNFRFRDGTNLNSSWFAHLRSIITWVSTNRVTLTLQGSLLVDLTDAIPTNLHVDVDSQRGLFSVSGGVTLTINSAILAGPYQCFSGAGTVVLPSVVAHYPEWYSSGTFTQATISAALTAIGTTNKATLLLRPGTWVISSNADWPAYSNVTFKIVPGALISHDAFTVNIPYLDAGLHQIFSGTGAVTLSGRGQVVHPIWYSSGAGTSAEPWTGYASHIAWMAGQKYIFDEGYYSYATAPSWALPDIEVEGIGKVYLVHTGMGSGIDLNNVSGSHYVGAKIRNLTLKGNANTTIGFDLCDMHRVDVSDIHIGPMSPTGTGFKIAFSVYSKFTNLNVDTKYVPGTTAAQLPAIGLHVTRTSGSDRTTDTIFENYAILNSSIAGILIDYANNNRFIGGSVEYCGKGISITGGTESAFNSFYSPYLENNTTHDVHIANGNNNSFYSPYLNAGAVGAAGYLVIDAGQGNAVYGGLASVITIASGVNNSVLSGVRVANIFNAGTNTKSMGCYHGSTFLQHPLLLEQQPRIMSITIDDGSDAAHIKCTSASVYRGDANAEQDNIGKDYVITGVWQLNIGGDNLLLVDNGIAGDLVAVLSVQVVTNLSATAINVKGVLTAHRMHLTFTNAATGAAVDLTTLVDTGAITLMVTYITDL